MVDSIAENQANQEVEQPYDASDPKQVNRARQKAGRRKATELDVVRTVMGSEAGRAWLMGVLQMCHISSPTFTPNDPHATSFKEGERNIGNRLLYDIMGAAPDLYLKMCQEHNFSSWA